ncbi:MAG: hypothetical protein ABR595_07015 [Psychroflexus sp.]
MKLKLDFKHILKSLLVLLVLTIGLLTISRWFSKNEAYRKYKNRNFTYGKYVERATKGRGATTALYEFIANGKKYKGNVTLATFSNSEPIVNEDYIVVYNSKKPKESTMFLNLKANDSLKQYFKNRRINKIPIESYERAIDSFYFLSLTGGVGQFFPPYYTKEDFPELKYLSEKE